MTGEPRQFDFWLGTWRGTWPAEDGVREARNVVTREYEGRVIVERFAAQAPETFAGTSVSVFDDRAHRWKQTWVDDTGSYLDFEGGFDGERMVLARRVVDAGELVLQRMVWHRIEPDAFQWLWQRSRSAGEWETLWTIAYERISSSSA